MTVWVTRGSAIDPPKVLHKVPYKVCLASLRHLIGSRGPVREDMV